jgi:RNA polymerase sigma-70 factor (ECF subfamily)
MGLLVHALARGVGGGVVEFPRGAGLEDGMEDGAGEVVAIDYAERDRRFAEMAERQARFMFRVAHGLLRSVQDAEDAVQEALLKLYRSDGWLHMEDEKAFLARTVWRVGLDVVARRPRGTEPLEDEAGREFAAGGESAEESLVGHGERELLRRLIEVLPEELRQPLVLSAIEEMTSREVAMAMGIPEGTVRTRVMRARGELKRRFEAMRKRKTTTDLHG